MAIQMPVERDLLTALMGAVGFGQMNLEVVACDGNNNWSCLAGADVAKSDEQVA